MTATGGFVARSERSSIDVRSTVPHNIGPGSYDLPGSSPHNEPAPAPFLSTLERKLMENASTSATTPGPGAYQTGQADDAATCKHAESTSYSAAFASATERLHRDKTHVGKPGPGAYTPPSDWIKHKHRYTAPSGSQRVSYKRVPSAPSIPYRHQCYGYEEGNQGMLVMQPPPDPIHTGVGRDTVGPGAYELVMSSSELPPRAVAFGNSKTRRGLQVSSITPGPGAYDLVKGNKGTSHGIVVSIAGVDVQFGGAQGSSQFASKVPITAHRRIQDWERTPGPGAYDAAKPLGKVLQPPPKELQFFGSTARRGLELDPTMSLSGPTWAKTPGPAAYNVNSSSIKIQPQSYTEPKPFNSSTNRFSDRANGVPGPGEYRPDLRQSLAKQVADKAAISKGGVFGTAAERWAMSETEQAHAAKLPGPGEYVADVKHEVVHRGSASMFASGTDRFKPATAPAAVPEHKLPTGGGTFAAGGPGQHLDVSRKKQTKGDPAKLGPGCYNLPDQWTKCKPKPGIGAASPGFGSGAIRHDPAKTPCALNPGPGRYNTAKDVSKALKPLSVPNPEAVFGSQVSRFKGQDSYTPGPGQYILSRDLLRKSHNVTYSTLGVA